VPGPGEDLTTLTSAEPCRREDQYRGAVGRGLEKLSRGLEKILGVGLNFKNGIPYAPHIQDLASSMHYSKRDHK